MSKHTHTVAAGDVKLHVEIEGEGTPLLLLHGFTGSSGDWQHARRELWLDQHQLIAIDARGHGRSRPPQELIRHRDCAADVLAVLDMLGVHTFRAIGMSMGANTLLHIAQLAPERSRAQVLVSGTMFYPERTRALMRAADPHTNAAEQERLLATHTGGAPQVNALVRAQRALADDYDDLAFTPPQLARINTPSLIVYGDRDPLYPVSMAVAMFEALPHAELAVVPNAGHGPVFGSQAAWFAELARAFFERATSAR